MAKEILVKSVVVETDDTGKIAHVRFVDSIGRDARIRLPTSNLARFADTLMDRVVEASGARILNTDSLDPTEKSATPLTEALDSYILARADGGGFVLDLRFYSGHTLRVLLSPDHARELYLGLDPGS